jgi:hypothetical protein
VKKGDIVTITNKYSSSYEKECIFLGYAETGKTKYLVLAYEKEDGQIDTAWEKEEYVKLLETAKYTPVPKFKVGDIVYYQEVKLMVLEERNEGLYYSCYCTQRKTITTVSEKYLKSEEEKRNEKPKEKAVEVMKDI